MKIDKITDYSLNTKKIYDEVYNVGGINYGSLDANLVGKKFPQKKINLISFYLKKFMIPVSANIVEIGASLGHLHVCHPNWIGIEYSATAVRLAKQIYGVDLNIYEADARDLPLKNESVDFLFTFATLEHVPEVENAFSEIERVLSPAGIAVISPAWNCRSWTVEKLIQRRYDELDTKKKFEKALIPIRENLLYRMLCSLPHRIYGELLLIFSKKRSIKLRYEKLYPNFSLWDKYPHISDDDAFVSMDAHAALVYFISRGWISKSHPNFLRRFCCRGGEIIVQKPA